MGALRSFSRFFIEALREVMAKRVTVWMGVGRAEVTRVGVAMMAEVMGYGVRDRTVWGRLGATNSCFNLGG